jgi:energy-coupling factor transporter ATP-binding protein EcfA2
MYHKMMDSIEPFAEWLNLRTDAARTSLRTQLPSWTSEEQTLLALQAKYKRMKEAMERAPALFPEAQRIFREMATLEPQLQTLMKRDSKVEEESYNELLFFKPLLQPLNFVPFLLALWSAIRVYILPGLSLLLPILTLIAPYLILRFVFQIPITFENYMNMLHAMVSGNMATVMNPSAVVSAPTNLLKQVGIVLVTFIQGILQPYWSHTHLHSIDSIIQEHGGKVIRFHELYGSLERLLELHGFTFFRSPMPSIRNERDAAARMMLQPTYFQMALKYVGSLEVLMTIANKKDIHPVHWVRSPHPVFRIQDSFDFQVPEGNRKTISAKLDVHRHALLTGPNKGGKSTVLRALSFSALLAHTYGCALGQLTATPFHHLFVCLTPDDLPGAKSRFEREVEFTAGTLVHSQPILVFIDELYHSTNPPDALRSCEMYCGQLWKKNNVVSVISTHLFELVKQAPSSIQRLCCPATLDDKGIIQFQYRLEKGMCTVSSVDMLLKKNGLIARLG